MKKRLIILPILIFCLTLTLSGCTNARESFIFGTFYNYKLDIKKSEASQIDSYLSYLDNTLSTSKLDSDISKFNNSAINVPISIHPETAELISTSIDLYKDTNGAFNISLYPLVKLWNFSPDLFHPNIDKIPSNEEVQNTLNLCKISNFNIDKEKNTITKLVEGTMLDLGGIAKGYAVDKTRLIAKNAKNGIINIGGNIFAVNSKKIGVQDPRGSDIWGVLDIDNISVATSGDYQRYYIINNIRYNHIINNLGYPTGLNGSHNPISVTIIGESAMLCDALSTAVMILNFDASSSLLKKLGYSAILVYNDYYKTIGDVNFEQNNNKYQKK